MTENSNNGNYPAGSAMSMAFETASSEATFFLPLPTYFASDAEDEDVAPLWLLTFTDVVALMLTFFVLLYSMSVPEFDKWSQMTTEAEQGKTNTRTLERFSGESADITISKISTSRALDLNYLANLINGEIQRNEKLGGILIFRSENNLIVSLPTDLVFQPGGATISAGGQRALFSLGGLFHKIRNRIEIIGHADPNPVEGGGFTSNWELSLARAASVAGILNEVGYSRDVIVRGLSSARFDEMSQDIPLDTRMDVARRVDIVIMSDDGRNRSFLNFGGSG